MYTHYVTLDIAHSLGVDDSKYARYIKRILVFVDSATGKQTAKVVDHEVSVLNIERDLLKHLNEAPRSTE